MLIYDGGEALTLLGSLVSLGLGIEGVLEIASHRSFYGTEMQHVLVYQPHLCPSDIELFEGRNFDVRAGI